MGGEATQSEILVGYAEQEELFHAPDGTTFATVEVDGHWETAPLKSRRYAQWLIRKYYRDVGKAPSAQALTEARATVSAMAAFDGPELPVHVRVAGHGHAVYLDLVNGEWEVVEITTSGWRVLPGHQVPVKFVRKANSAPLPHPAAGGSFEDLRPFANVRNEDHFKLVVGWLVGALNPRGPYPLLVVQGEQGSAKSTTVRVLVCLVDPAVEPLRAPPRDERDLVIGTSGSWALALDNLSGVRPWLSDALCRLATGGGFATRALYTDDGEIVFSQKRPVILNGIDALAVAGDLRDRSLILDLPPIPPNKKRTEHDFHRDLEAVRPRVLGALLDAVSAALRNLGRVEMTELPRMADFATWVVAAEEAMPWERGAFMSAYAGNRIEANELALTDDPLAGAIRRLLADRDEWSGTSTELLAELGELIDEGVRRSKAWPGGPQAMSNRLKRLSPALREGGIEYQERTEGRAKRKVKTLRRMVERNDRIGRTDMGGEVSAGAAGAAGGVRPQSGDEGRLRFSI